MKYLIRPLSKTMVDKLKLCRQIELKGIKERACNINDIHYAMGPLYKRGLIDIKKKQVDGKEFHCVFVTEAGVDFLNNYERDEQKTKQPDAPREK